VAPRTPVEEIVADIWSQLLNVERIGVADNFFELGGHSLLATQVISRVRDAFGQEVALRSLFEQPTVAGLARAIEAGSGLGADLQAPPLERVERAEQLPLSFAQQRLWFLDQLEPGSSFYNIPAAVRLRGTLNIEALERTLSEVVRRHEGLRTHFIAIDGEPVQVIEAAAPLRLAVLDLSGMEEAAREAEMQRLVAAESLRPFDLMKGPLLRLSLLRLGAEEHVALVTMHHIVSDGWSIGVLVREVAALYGAYVLGQESPLEELAIQYADFAHWQRGWLQGEVLAAQLEYWRAELADAPTVIDLPIDKPRPPVQTYHGAHQPFQLSTELSAQLRELSRRHGATLFMTLLAAFDVLLCRYAGQDQVLVGTPIANRNRSETEALIGFFVNTLVLRGDVRGNPSFRELLRRVRETALSAYAHQDLPFEKLVEELQPERDMSRSALFQVMFVLQNAPGEALELEGLSLSGVESASDTVKFELTLALQEFEGMVVGGLNYNRDLYEPETIERIVQSYERVLQAVATDAEQRVVEIDLLSEDERRQIIEGWNEAEPEYAPALTLTELFEAQAARTPEAIALFFEDTTLSYRELNERSNQLAHYLQRQGVGPESLVGILMDRSVEMIVAVLGILKAGGAYVPLDPSYPVERLEFMVQDSGMRMLLIQERLSEVPGGYLGATLSLTEQRDSIAGASRANPASRAQPEQVAYVIYTSGSTGRPKGVLVSHENVVRLLEATQTHFEFNQSDVWTLFHSYAFDFSVWEIWGALAYGGKLVIVPYWISRSAQAFHHLLASQQVTVLNQTPSAFRQLMAADESAGDGVELKLRLVIFGGEALELQTLRPWFARHGDGTPRLVNMFGITETTVHVTYRALTAADLALAPSSVIGRPLGCLQVYLLDGHGQPVPLGVPGEICVGGSGLARGYLNRAELTAERFVPHPFSTLPGARLYRSGDLARFLPNGDIEYLGRIDQQVKVRGYRIELGEIEAALAEHEGVRECTLVATADANGETKLLAYLVNGRQQPAPSVTELREFLQVKLPEYMIPAAFIMLDAMPLTLNGKIDRRALPVPDHARPELGKEFVGPRTPVEEIVAGIWEELLDVKPVGVRDDFFSLGGHSLLAVRLMARIQANFGQHLRLASLFQGATVEKQASLLHELPHDRSTSALVNIQPKGEGLPFFCVHPGGGNVLCYRELSNHLGLEQPFYGLQARGLDENQVPHTRIEDMAASYIDAIRSVQPAGPYLLGGWSMGGVVAYEMAQQLEAQGQQVSLLALMDARPSLDDAAPLDEITLLINFAHDLGLSVDGLKLSTDELAKLNAEELLNYVLQRAIEAGIVPQDIQLAHARRLFEVFKLNVQAMQSYRPQPSSMRVTLLKAGEQRAKETSDETMGWGALTSGEVEIHTVPGSHFTIVREPYVRSLAEQLADCINTQQRKSN
jgi:amino acid adenylation domain-containing protein